jgi:uncharacterized membrane protein
MTMSIPMKGALVGAALALVWVEWGFGAMVLVVLAAIIGAMVALTATGRWNVVEAFRQLQDRP